VGALCGSLLEARMEFLRRTQLWRLEEEERESFAAGDVGEGHVGNVLNARGVVSQGRTSSIVLREHDGQGHVLLMSV
jgi:hypothetical protein